MMSGMRTSRLFAKAPKPERVMRFNPPPTWPPAPVGWTPEPGWQPDPSWGPVPLGWYLWVDEAAVAGWPPPEVTPSRMQLMVSITLCVVLGLGSIVAYGLVAGDPGINDPIAVLVQNGGTEVDVAMSSCRHFEVTDVRIVAQADAYGDPPGPEEVIWDLRLVEADQRVFHLAATGSPAAVPYKTLSAVPSADSLFVEVDYVHASAPKGFTDRTQLSKPVDRTSSNSDRRTFDRALARKC
jgi:hypothetical protein